MKHKLLLAVPAFAGLLHAAPFEGRGLPAETSAVIHLDLDAAGESRLAPVLREIGEAVAAKSQDADSKALSDALKKELGVDDKAVADVSVAIFKPAAPGGEPDAVIRVRGAFDRAKFESISKNHPEVKANQLGGYTWYSADDLNKLLKGRGGLGSKGCVTMINNGTILAASKEAVLSSALAAAEGKSAYAPSADARAALGSKVIVAGYFPEAFISAMKPAAPAKNPQGKPEPQVKSVVFTINEDTQNLNVHADTRFDSASGATQLQAQAAMFAGFAGMGLAQENPNETPEQRADKAFAVSALQALKFSAKGESFLADFSFPAETLVAKLKEKRQAIVEGIEKQAAGANKPANKPVAKRGAKTAPAVVAPASSEE